MFLKQWRCLFTVDIMLETSKNKAVCQNTVSPFARVSSLKHQGSELLKMRSLCVNWMNVGDKIFCKRIESLSRGSESVLHMSALLVSRGYVISNQLAHPSSIFKTYRFSIELRMAPYPCLLRQSALQWSRCLWRLHEELHIRRWLFADLVYPKDIAFKLDK